MKYSSLILCALIAACNNSSISSSVDDTTVNTGVSSGDTTFTPAPNNKTCYAYQSATDSVMLTINAADQNVYGNLVYAYSGKDRNSGTFNGSMKGDTLFADYVFMSEGKSSVRQVAFLKKGAGFIEGYGDVQMEGGKMVFKNTSALKFSSAMPLQQQLCDSL